MLQSPHLCCTRTHTPKSVTSWNYRGALRPRVFLLFTCSRTSRRHLWINLCSTRVHRHWGSGNISFSALVVFRARRRLRIFLFITVIRRRGDAWKISTWHHNLPHCRDLGERLTTELFSTRSGGSVTSGNDSLFFVTFAPPAETEARHSLLAIHYYFLRFHQCGWWSYFLRLSTYTRSNKVIANEN